MSVVASVVPDVSGIDKVFDYLIPSELEDVATLGARVRIVLNGRKVGGWIVDIQPYNPLSGVALERLSSISRVSGHGVEPDMVAITRWIATMWYGSWRAVLSSASAPLVTRRVVHERYGQQHNLADDEVTRSTISLLKSGGGLLIVPPCASALAVVATMAASGPVLAVCPTQRMASLGAAALRRRGLTTAVLPDEWDQARAGVDVVIGARSSVLGPCRDIASIIVIDEHDESLKQERNPSWDAPTVAIERGRVMNVPVIVTSSIPSPYAVVTHADHTLEVVVDRGWPKVTIVELNDVPVSGSLLSSELLESVGVQGRTTVCMLNTKGIARLLACQSCRALQMCPTCNAALTQTDSGDLHCGRCETSLGGVCVSCGRTKFAVLRGGVGQLRNQLTKSSANPVIEITADSTDEWERGNVFVGTEAVLHRIGSADCVVFCDIDRDLFAPRLSGSRETLALIARAARSVGADGTIVIQTRQPSHPMLQACLSARTDHGHALRQWSVAEISQRRDLSLPPFSYVVIITVSNGEPLCDLSDIDGIHVASHEDGYLVRADTRENLEVMLERVKTIFGKNVKIHIDPRRF